MCLTTVSQDSGHTADVPSLDRQPCFTRTRREPATEDRESTSPSPGIPTVTMNNTVFINAARGGNAVPVLHTGGGNGDFGGPLATELLSDSSSDQSGTHVLTPSSSSSTFDHLPPQDFSHTTHEGPIWPPVAMNSPPNNTAYAVGCVAPSYTGDSMLFDPASSPLPVGEMPSWVPGSEAFGVFEGWVDDAATTSHGDGFVLQSEVVSLPLFSPPKGTRPCQHSTPQRAGPGPYLRTKPPSNSRLPLASSASVTSPPGHGYGDQPEGTQPSPSASPTPEPSAFPPLTPCRGTWTRAQERFLLESKRNGRKLPEISAAMLKNFGVQRNPNVLSKKYGNLVQRGNHSVSTPRRRYHRGQD